jgi:uroporphyrinogen-III synthase/predicted DCC family thiol-disulfide oxidoreductase YuxK
MPIPPISVNTTSRGGVYIIWTRSREDWSSDATLFAATPTALHVPCLKVERIDKMRWPSEPAETIVLTSRSAFKFAQRNENGLKLLQQCKQVITFGEKTRSLVEKAGFPVVCPKDIRSAEELARWLVTNDKVRGSLYVFGPEKPAFPIAQYLSERGWKARHVSLYRTVSLEPDLSLLLPQLQVRTVIVCLASPSAANAFASAWKMWPGSSNTELIPIAFARSTSETTQERLGNHLVCPKSTVEALARQALLISKLRKSNVTGIAFFDGHCNLCNHSVDWLLRQKPENTLRIASLQGEAASKLLSEGYLTKLETMVYMGISPPSINIRSAAIASALGHVPRRVYGLKFILAATPRWLSDLFYAGIARMRMVLFGKRSSCRLPTAAEGRIFLA